MNSKLLLVVVSCIWSGIAGFFIGRLSAVNSYHRIMDKMEANYKQSIQEIKKSLNL